MLQGPRRVFSSPQGVVVDASGNVYVADTNNNKIRKISSSGVVTTFAGSGLTGSTDGIGTAASFNRPMGLAIDASGIYLWLMVQTAKSAKSLLQEL